MLMFMYMYVCNHVSMSLFDRVVRDHSCGEIIAYAAEWHDEAHGHMGNQVGRVVMKNIQGQYHVDVN